MVVNLIVMDMLDFVVMLSMDFLSRYRAYID